jgi:hypothetical protein
MKRSGLISSGIIAGIIVWKKQLDETGSLESQPSKKS